MKNKRRNGRGTTALEWDAMGGVMLVDGITQHRYLPEPIVDSTGGTTQAERAAQIVNMRILAASRSLGNPLEIKIHDGKKKEIK